MKKVTLAIAMAALVIFAGCKKDKETNGTMLKASIEQYKSGDSKTSIVPVGNEAEIHWTAGDKIVVNNGATSGTFTLTSEAGSTTGDFIYNGVYTFGDNNIAVYPETATINGSEISVTLPAVQTYAAERNGSTPMLSTFTDPNSLTFTSLCGALGISLKAASGEMAITAIEVVSKTTNETLNGTFTCTTASPQLTVAEGDSNSNKVRLNCNATLTNEPQNFYFAMPVGALHGGFTLNVYGDGAEPIFSTNTSNDITIALNQVNQMPTVTVTTAVTVPDGAIGGTFTINPSGNKVFFSQGNLQYQASTNTWRFAENQYDYIGSDNSNISQNYSGWIDLFGWGTSGYNHGAVCYQPWSTSQTNSDYYAYGSDTYNLNDQTGQADWGYNAISNGGNTTHQWRTLTKDEWNYVFNTRSGIRYAKAQVNNVNGVILLPDDWSTSYYSLSSTNSDVSFSSNVISESSWTSSLQSHGAVFLPAAGRRDGTSVDGVGSYGFYRSASYYDSDGAWYVYFSNGRLYPDHWRGRNVGFPVRLVCPAQ